MRGEAATEGGIPGQFRPAESILIGRNSSPFMGIELQDFREGEPEPRFKRGQFVQPAGCDKRHREHT